MEVEEEEEEEGVNCWRKGRLVDGLSALMSVVEGFIETLKVSGWVDGEACDGISAAAAAADGAGEGGISSSGVWGLATIFHINVHLRERHGIEIYYPETYQLHSLL